MTVAETNHRHCRRPETTRKKPMKSLHTLRTLRTLSVLSIAALGALLATPTLAQEGGYSYGGLSVGQSRAKIDQARITAGLLGSGLSTSAFSRDESGQGFKVFGGYQINRNFAVEAGYFNLGKFGFSATTVPAGTLSGSIRVQGLNLDLVGTLPLTERLSAIARVGGQYAQARDTLTGGGAVTVLNPNPSERGFNAKLGAGLQYEFSRSFLMRVEAERSRINDAVGNRGDVNLYSLSLVFPFGRAPAPAPRVAAAPAYVAPAPAPAPAAPPIVAPPPPPVVAVAPVAPVVLPPVRRRVSFSADSLFTFDKSLVRPEGKAALDKFAQELKGGTQYDVITVEGHTDRLGSTAYNQRLSAQRAEAVKAYLVSSGGVPGPKITAVGKGETAPVTKAADCVGNKPTQKLIACLQPDRRVEVEVTGTR